MITVPLFGEMKAEGLTPLQLEQQMTDLLSGNGKNPEVSVTVWEVRNKKYTVSGQVKRPGSYPLSRPTTVFDAIFDAGGFVDNFSDQTDILILRGSQALHFNYEDHVRGENRDRNIALENGDTIVVKARRRERTSRYDPSASTEPFVAIDTLLPPRQGC
jgi:polysaccharide biosynthesis/export protein